MSPLLFVLMLCHITLALAQSSSSSSSTASAASLYLGRWESVLGNCSEPCGPGLAFSEAACVIDTIVVSDSNCNASASKPLASSTYCNVAPCVVTLLAWRTDLRCGAGYPAPDGTAISECNPDSSLYHCCSAAQRCGSSVADCTCSACIDYTKRAQNLTEGDGSSDLVPSSGGSTVLIAVLTVVCVLVGVAVLCVVARIASRWKVRRRYLQKQQAQQAQRGGAPPQSAQLASIRRAFGPSEAAALAEASSRNNHNLSRSSVAPAPCSPPVPAVAPSPASVSLSLPSESFASAIPRLHLEQHARDRRSLLSPPAAAAPSCAFAASPRSQGELAAVSPREIDFEENLESEGVPSLRPPPSPRRSAAPARSSVALLTAVAVSSSSSSPPRRIRPTIASNLPSAFGQPPTSSSSVSPTTPGRRIGRGGALQPLSSSSLSTPSQTSSATFASLPASAVASATSPLDLIDRSHHLSFGAAGRSPIVAGAAATPVGASPRSFGHRSIAAGSAVGSSSSSSSSPPPPVTPPRLRAPLRHGQHSSSTSSSLSSFAGGLSPAAKIALAEPIAEHDHAINSRREGEFAAPASASASASLLPCSICLSNASDAMIVPCGHSSFCFACLTRWSSTQSNCPVCRHAISHISQMTAEDVRRRDKAESPSK